MKYEVVIKNNEDKRQIGVKLPGSRYVERYLEKIKSLNKYSNNFSTEVHEVN